ncbi:MAG TPA: hypothetical protein VEK11_00845 [Thermoanaerobaculia bacterium]|jgi:hypothetical protein|nr:hypothetical protein [Thermoanaerobaculia bacterium]
MKRLLVTVALAIFALPSFAAIQYEFTVKSTSDDAIVPATDLSGRATVDGDRSRVDFLGGNMYPPGTYVLTSDASRRLTFVDPTKRWYTEVNTSGIATAIGASNITVENFQSNVEPLGDRRTIAGIEADHYRVTMSYDITVVKSSMPLKQHVRTEIDTWTTLQFGQVHQSFITGGFRTGNAQLDKIIETEATRVQGFPLRQTVTIKTSYDLPVRSNLNKPTQRTITRETWVNAIREMKSDPAVFVLPASYRRADTPELPKAAAQTLQFEPADGTK